MNMNQIEKQLDSIIARLKLCDSLSQVRFIREYGSHNIEMPVTGFLAVVSVTDTSLSKKYIGGYMSASVKGEQYAAKAEICVYAPADENGSGLSEITCEMLSALKKADCEGIIEDSKVTSIDFDADMNAIFRTVELNIEFCLCEEA